MLSSTPRPHKVEENPLLKVVLHCPHVRCDMHTHTHTHMYAVTCTHTYWSTHVHTHTCTHTINNKDGCTWEDIKTSDFKSSSMQKADT